MINKTYDKQIQAWLEANRQRILDEWMELVRIPSVQGPAEPGAPFGPACAKAVKAAADCFARRDISVRLEEENRYALAHIGDGDKCISLFGHSDVVPVGDGWLFSQPFEPVIHEGMLIGRGARDNKSGVMASLCVLSALKECNIPLRSRIQAYIGSNEESGMQDMIAFAKKETPPDLCLVPDSQFPCGLGEKGILRMWARSDGALTAIRDMQGGDAFNTVLDRVVTVLAPNSVLARQLQDACAQNTAFTLQTEADGTQLLTAVGVAQHAAYPKGAVNATQLTAGLLLSCDALPAQDRQILETVAAYLTGFDGSAMGIAHSDPDFGDLTAANGMVSMEDGHLKLSLDIRYGSTKDPKALEATLYRAWQSKGWQITYMDNRPGFRVDPQSPVPNMLRSVFQTLTGNDAPFYFMPGGTYSRYLKNAFTVGTCALTPDRTNVGSFLPKGHGGAHQRDEAIDIEGFFLAVRVLAHYVLACDAHLHTP